MKKIYWFSRHSLTNGQVSCLQAKYGENIIVKQENLIFNDNIVKQIENITTKKTIALVAPLQYGLILLRAGYKLIEFINIPSARTKGMFLCKGMNIHTLHNSEFIECPIPVEKQEEGNLNYEGRK